MRTAITPIVTSSSSRENPDLDCITSASLSCCSPLGACRGHGLSRRGNAGDRLGVQWHDQAIAHRTKCWLVQSSVRIEQHKCRLVRDIPRSRPSALLGDEGRLPGRAEHGGFIERGQGMFKSVPVQINELRRVQLSVQTSGPIRLEGTPTPVQNRQGQGERDRSAHFRVQRHLGVSARTSAVQPVCRESSGLTARLRAASFKSALIRRDAEAHRSGLEQLTREWIAMGRQRKRMRVRGEASTRTPKAAIRHARESICLCLVTAPLNLHSTLFPACAAAIRALIVPPVEQQNAGASVCRFDLI